MSEIVKIPLQLVKPTYYITTQNTTKFLLQSICHMKNACSQIIENLIASAQKQSAGCWKIIKMYPKTSTFIVINIAVIYCAYKIKTNYEFREETLMYSIIPSKMITSSVLFNDGEIEIFTGGDYFLSLMNDNTRNLILSEELNANIEEPFPRSKPIPIKFDRFHGLLDNGKLTLKTEDGDTTFTFHNTLSLEVKKTSTTLQDETATMEKETCTLTKTGQFNFLIPNYKITLKTSKIDYNWPNTTVDRFDPVKDVSSNSSLKYNDAFPIIGNFSFSYEDTVKIQADESDEVYHLTHNVKIECDKKVDENLQNIIATKEVSPEDMIPGKTKIVFDCGTVVFKTINGRKIVVSKKLDLVIFEDGQKIAYLDWVPDAQSSDI